MHYVYLHLFFGFLANYIFYVVPASGSSQCGRRPLFRRESGARIIGGRAARRGEQPWQVVLRRSRRDNVIRIQNFCGGVIIHKRWILTAAHCFRSPESPVPSDKPQLLEVVSGILKIKKYDLLAENYPRNVHSASEIIVHEQFNLGNVGISYDIALVRLNKDIVFDETTQPICLPHPGDSFNKRVCTVSGWGVTVNDDFAPLAPKLRQVDLPVISHTICQRVYDRIPYDKEIISPRNLCTYYPQGGKDFCSGDSGGPLLCRIASGQFVAAGIVSWSEEDKCGVASFASVYINVAKFHTWIMEKTGHIFS